MELQSLEAGAAPSTESSSSVSTKVEEASTSSSSSLAERQQEVNTQTAQSKSADLGGKSFQSFLSDAGMMSNRQIVHELALDREFKLQLRKRSGIEKAVEEQARKAFWDVMREDVLQRGDLAKWIPGMAESVKSRLLRLLDAKGSLYAYINDSIDIKIIEQQCHAGAYDYERFFRFVLDILPRICSPARDEAVKALVDDTGDYIERLQKLLDVLELLQLDHANFLLMMSASHVIPEAIPYERRLFSADLEAGNIGLERTRRWLTKAREEKEEESRNRDPEGNGGPNNTPSATEVYNYAFVGLTMKLEKLKTEDIPETFHLDVDRLLTIREEIKNIVVGASITLTIKNLLRRDIRSAWNPLKERLLPLLEAKKSPAELTADMVAFVQETVAVPPTLQNHILAAVNRLGKPGACETDPVVRVMARRLRDFVSARLNADNAKERVRLVAGGGEALGSLGMAEWIGEVGQMVEKLGGLAGFNRECSV
ncbi:hypothetical protein RUND412_005201 [Rhizina undulata]